MSGSSSRDRAPAAPIFAQTRHGPISLDEMAALLPGLGALMPLIADRYVLMYFAARGGNWALANYEYLQMAHLFRTGMKTRPRQAGRLQAYLEEFGQPLRAAIKATDLAAFERASAAAIRETNRVHAEMALPYIVFKLPDEPPGHLDFERQTVADEELS